jgi:valine dehydrogenase (NAD+)
VSVFELGSSHEQVVFCNDPASGLRAIVAIYSTALGPALGGTRFYPYANEDDALSDVLNLSQAMAYKAACAGLDLGGGKAVIIGDPATDKTEALLRSYGRVVQALAGRD